jgi:hypothetical protein
MDAGAANCDDPKPLPLYWLIQSTYVKRLLDIDEVAHIGLEPMTLALLAPRSNQLS